MSTAWIVVLSVGSPLLYMIGIGVTYALCPDKWNRETYDVLGTRGWVSALWPFVAPVLLAILVTQRAIARRKASTLPVAKVVR